MPRLKVLKNGPGGKYVRYSIGIPAELGQKLVEAGVRDFSLTLTAEGIVLRPVKGIEERVELPAWLNGGEGQ